MLGLCRLWRSGRQLVSPIGVPPGCKLIETTLPGNHDVTIALSSSQA